MSPRGFVVVAHGGAGRAPERPGWPDRARAGMAEALDAGGAVLEASGSALDAVQATVRVLESDVSFNAGLGSVANADGEVEMDAALMEGTGQHAGSLAGLRAIRHPIDAARRVLDAGGHLFYAGAGAERFAQEAGLERIDPEDLIASAPSLPTASSRGTVGAVALDREGRLAAATSTGGTPGKSPGRVSDSAVIGAGTWADDRSCAVSTTGHGEAFMRCVFAHAVAERRLRGIPIDVACAQLLQRVAELGGEGGCIAVDTDGEVALPYDTPLMPRGVLRHGTPPRIDL